MPFQKGQSGNPAGRPRGSRNRKTIVLQKMLDDDGQAILQQAMKMAKEGNTFALRLCMERLLPKRRHEPLECELPPIGKAADAVTAMGDIAAAVGAGEVAPAEAAALTKVVTGCRDSLLLFPPLRRRMPMHLLEPRSFDLRRFENGNGQRSGVLAW